MPQSVPETIVIPKAPPETMVLWGRPSEVRSYQSYVVEKKSSSGGGWDGPLLVGAGLAIAAMVVFWWAGRRMRSGRSRWAVAAFGFVLTCLAVFALTVGVQFEAEAGGGARRERDHWAAVADNLVTDVLVERRASNRGFLRAVDRRRLVYTSPKWLLVVDFEKDRFLAVPARHVRQIAVPAKGQVPGRLSAEPRLDDAVVSFVPGGKIEWNESGNPYAGRGPVRIETDLEQPREIYLQRGDGADRLPPQDFVKQLAAGLDPVEHYRQRTNPNGGGA